MCPKPDAPGTPPPASLQIRPDQSLGVGAVPFGRADEAAEFAALGVDQQGRRHADGLEGETQLRGRFMVELQRLGIDVFEELGGFVRAATVDADGDHLELVTAKLGLQAVSKAREAGRATGQDDVLGELRAYR